MKFLFAIAAFLALTAVAFGADEKAKAECRKLYHIDADNHSHFTNSGCTLYCGLHGAVVPHFAYENSPCPSNLYGRCVRGQCKPNRRVKEASLALTGRPQIGHIDVNIISAQLANKANAYMAVCIQNSTAPMTLPISNRHNCVVYCTNHPVYNSRTPVWNSVCAGSGKYLFAKGSRVTFEIFDHQGTGQNIFMGGASFTIPNMLKNGDNNKKITLPLSGAHTGGKMQVRVTYTPR